MGDTPPPRHRDRYSSSLSPRERERPERSRSRTPPRREKSGPVSDRLDRSRSRTPPRRSSRREPDALNPGNNLYVTGLSTRVNEKDLQEHFSQEGKVLECRLVLDPRTRESRGFGFVTMDQLEDAERCIKYLNRSTLEGRMITVEKNPARSASTNTTLPFSVFHGDIKASKRNVSERVLPLPASILASVLCKRIVVEVVEGEGVEAIPAMAGTCGTRQNTHLIKVVEIAAATGAATGHLGIPLTAAMRVTARLLPNMVPIVADDLRWRSVDVFHDLTLGICYWSVGYF